jgi:hypothetical protein
VPLNKPNQPWAELLACHALPPYAHLHR